MNWFLVAIGGAFGACARYACTLALQDYGLPSGVTTWVNILGAFVLGLCVGAGLKTNMAPVYLLLGVGFCGAFTTYSTFNIEMLELLEAEEYLRVIPILSLTLIGALISGGLGIYLGRVFRIA